jgi:hypothetical protein
MAFTNFSGPIRAGTKLQGAGDNSGLVLLSQVYDSGDLTGATVGNIDVQPITLPAGAQVVDLVVDQVVAATGGTTTVSVGTAAGGAQLMGATATTAGGRFRGAQNSAALQLAWQLGATDAPVHVRVAVGSNTLTAGRLIVTVLYVQRDSTGATHPAAS